MMARACPPRPSASPAPAWRRSYDVDDPRAQVAATCWQPSENHVHAFRFFDVIGKAIWQYSDHVREPGKPMPICANALKVFEALVSFMDFTTGRCDPALDTIAARCKLSRRTVVRQLEVLRRERIIDWARRTVRTGNAPGEGPQRRQTSNAYFIDLARLPTGILGTLRQKLGHRLKEAKSRVTGSGPVPSRMAGKAGRLITGLVGALNTSSERDRSNRLCLAAASAEERLAFMYRGDRHGLSQHLAMLGGAHLSGASAKVALYPSSRSKG